MDDYPNLAWRQIIEPTSIPIWHGVGWSNERLSQSGTVTGDRRDESGAISRQPSTDITEIRLLAHPPPLKWAKSLISTAEATAGWTSIPIWRGKRWSNQRLSQSGMVLG